MSVDLGVIIKNSHIEINRFQIGVGCQPFIIAELSGNHNGSLGRALDIVDAVAKAGAHAIKLQTYTPDTMTININSNEFLIGGGATLWGGESLYSLYEKAQTPWDWHQPIFERARAHGMIGFSSPFDGSSVEFLESLNVPLYKIASSELVDLNLIRAVAETRKTILMSTGMASVAEIYDAIETARRYGSSNIILLKCTASYPSDPRESNLLSIPVMRDLFNLQVGLSDHTLGIGVPVASVAMGATVIEKHVTLSRGDGGVDAAFSLEPDELASLVRETKIAHLALGDTGIGPTISELKSLKYRRSLYAVQDIRAGEILTPDNVRSIRPGLGLPPKYLDIILGRKVKYNINRGTPIDWGFIN